MKERINLAGISIEPGEKRAGWMPVDEVGGNLIQMPFTVINGAEDGFRLSVMAGIHGCEYSGIEASIRLGRDLKPEAMKGSLCIVHVVNVPAFQSRTPYVCPIDGLNLNRIRDVIPHKKPAGTISHRILYTLFHYVIYPSEACIDMHAGDLFETLSEPFIIYPVTSDQNTNKTAREMAEAHGIRYICGMEERGIVPAEGEPPIPSIMVECGQEGRIDEKYVNIHYQGVKNIMHHFGMIEDDDRQVAEKKPVQMKKAAKIECEVGGLFYSHVEPSDRVLKGDLIGEIKDIWGEVKQEIFAPSDGMILMYINNPVVGPGDVVLGYAEF